MISNLFNIIPIENLEQEFEKKPKAFQRRCFLLALLGYCYIFIVVLFMLIITLIIVFVACYLKLYFLFKFLAVFFIFFVLIIKSLYIKIPKQTGIKLSRIEASKIYELIDNLSLKIKSPKIHEILIDNEINCTVSQYPRPFLELFGLYENTITIGLPLLDLLTVDEFTSVLAHELAHLSDKHGAFILFIYRVRRSWEQIYLNLTKNSESSTYNKLLIDFAKWYVPYFDAFSAILLRSQESSADNISASITSGQTLAKALIRIGIANKFFNDKHIEVLNKKIQILRIPPNDIPFLHREIFNLNIEKKDIAKILNDSIELVDKTDSHPPLLNRLNALLPDTNWVEFISNIDNLKFNYNAEPSAITLLNTVTDEKYTEYFKNICGKFYEEWTQDHESYNETFEKINYLELKFKEKSISKEEVCELGYLYFTVKFDKEALDLLLSLIEPPFNDVAILNYYIGLSYRDIDNQLAIKYLNKSVELDISFLIPSYSVIIDFLEEQKKIDEANDYKKKIEDYAVNFDLEYKKCLGLNKNDIVEKHDLSDKELAIAGNLFYFFPQIVNVYAIKKSVPKILNNNQIVFLVTFNRPNWFKTFYQKIHNSLLDALNLPNSRSYQFLTLKDVDLSLFDNLPNLLDLLVYNRSSYEKNNVEKPEVDSNVLINNLKIYYFKYKYHLMFLVLLTFIFANVYKFNINDFNNYNDSKETKAKILRHISHYWRPPDINIRALISVAFVIDSKGYVSDVRIVRSSGYPSLDDSVKQAVLDAAPLNITLINKKSYPVILNFYYGSH